MYGAWIKSVIRLTGIEQGIFMSCRHISGANWQRTQEHAPQHADDAGLYCGECYDDVSAGLPWCFVSQYGEGVL